MLKFFHVFLFETPESKKEWEDVLKKACEKTVKWDGAGKAGALRNVRTFMTKVTDSMVGTVKKTVAKTIKKKQKGEQREMKKGIKSFFN